MMGIGFPELMVILIIIMIIFGAGKLPEIGSAFGRSIKNFKQSMKEADQVEPAIEGDSEETGTVVSEEKKDGVTQSEPTNQDQQTGSSAKKSGTKKEEEDIIDQAIKELKNEISENKIHTVKTRHDGLVQERDVFTDSVNRVPFGMKRSDRGISRDVL